MTCFVCNLASTWLPFFEEIFFCEVKRTKLLRFVVPLRFVVKRHPPAPGLADKRWRFEEGLAGMYALVLCAPGVCARVHGSGRICVHQSGSNSL
jgi:hypothetical protein